MLQSNFRRRVVALVVVVLGVFGVSVVSSPAGASVSCDRYASVSGSDADAGTLAAPFASAQKLADSLSAGQTGCLRGGTYDPSGSMVLTVRHGGAAGSPLTIMSYPGERARLVG